MIIILSGKPFVPVCCLQGDAFFVINEYDLPLRCQNGSSSNARGCFLDVDDVVMHFQVDVDGKCVTCLCVCLCMFWCVCVCVCVRTFHLFQ